MWKPSSVIISHNSEVGMRCKSAISDWSYNCQQWNESRAYKSWLGQHRARHRAIVARFYFITITVGEMQLSICLAKLFYDNYNPV